MELKRTWVRIYDSMKKYRYVLLVLAVGILLMMLPSKKEQKEAVKETPAVQAPGTEQLLQQILSRVEGAGQVEVMLTVAKGETKYYQTNTSVNGAGENASSQSDTVTLSDAQRNESGLIRRVDPPVFQGAIVVCEGAESPAVRLAVVNAVSNVTGLGADKISVLKMK